MLGGNGSHRETALQARYFVPDVTGGSVGVGIMDNILGLLCSGEFDLQREALIALQNAVSSSDTGGGCTNGLAILLHHANRVAVLRELVQLLKVPAADSEVCMACMRVVRAVFDCRSQLSQTSPAMASVAQSALEVCYSAGMMDAIDDIQVLTRSLISI